MGCWVWLVGEPQSGAMDSRFLLKREKVYVECLADVSTAFRRKSWALEGTQGFVLRGNLIYADIPDDSDIIIEEGEIHHALSDGLMLLYRVSRNAPADDASVRRMVDDCLYYGASLESIPGLLKCLAGVHVGHTKVERNWREALLLKDIKFLLDSSQARQEHRLFLLPTRATELQELLI